MGLSDEAPVPSLYPVVMLVDEDCLHCVPAPTGCMPPHFAGRLASSVREGVFETPTRLVLANTSVSTLLLFKDRTVYVTVRHVATPRAKASFMVDLLENRVALLDMLMREPCAEMAYAAVCMAEQELCIRPDHTFPTMCDTGPSLVLFDKQVGVLLHTDLPLAASDVDVEALTEFLHDPLLSRHTAGSATFRKLENGLYISCTDFVPDDLWEEPTISWHLLYDRTPDRDARFLLSIRRLPQRTTEDPP